MTTSTPDRTAAEAALISLPLPSVWLDGVELPRETAATLGPLRVRLEASAPAVCELEFDLDQRGPRPGRGAALRLRIGAEAEDVFDGEVVALAHRLGPDGLHRVRLRAFDRSHRLRQTSAVTAHIDVTVSSLADTLASAHGLSVDAEEDGPRWPRVIQQGESDLELLSRLVADAGLWWQLEGEDLRLRRRRSEQTYDVTWGVDLLEAEVADDATGTASSVRAFGWDPVERKAWEAEAGRSDAGSPDAGSGEQLGGTGARLLSGAVFPGVDHAEALAQRELDLRIGGETTIRAVVRGEAKWRPGCALRLADQSADIAGPFLVAAVEHVLDPYSGYVCIVSSHPVDGPATHGADAGFTASRAVASTSHTSGTAFAMAEVIDVDDPDRAGRAKVSFPALDDVESEWLPVLSLGAGQDKGLFCQPDVGDTVLALYAADDPGRGVILGGLYADHLPGDAAGVADRAVRRFGWNTSDGQRLLLNRDGDAIVVANSAGSTIEITADAVRVHAEADLTIEAPGKKMVLRADTIDFERG